MRKTSISRDNYVGRYTRRAIRLFNNIAPEVAEELGIKTWDQHRKENFKHLETPEKDVEIEWMYVYKQEA